MAITIPIATMTTIVSRKAEAKLTAVMAAKVKAEDSVHKPVAAVTTAGIEATVMSVPTATTAPIETIVVETGMTAAAQIMRGVSRLPIAATVSGRLRRTKAAVRIIRADRATVVKTVVQRLHQQAMEGGTGVEAVAEITAAGGVPKRRVTATTCLTIPVTRPTATRSPANWNQPNPA
jgi:hypothetical protein